jgi:hypothetical protein
MNSFLVDLFHCESIFKIIIGIIVDLFALIPSLLLVQLFRRLRSRQRQISPLRQAMYKVKPNLEMFVEFKMKGVCAALSFVLVKMMLTKRRVKLNLHLLFLGGVYLLHMGFV